jgi:hypothetical protein
MCDPVPVVTREHVQRGSYVLGGQFKSERSAQHICNAGIGSSDDWHRAVGFNRGESGMVGHDPISLLASLAAEGAVGHRRRVTGLELPQISEVSMNTLAQSHLP